MSVLGAPRPLLLDPPPSLAASPAAAAPAATAASPLIVRSRPVRVDAAALPTPASEPGTQSLVNLFPDLALTVEWNKLDRHGTRNYCWHGHTLDDALGAATLTAVGDSLVLAVISPGKGHFELLSRSDGSSEVRQFDPEKLKGNGTGAVSNAVEASATAAAPMATGVAADNATAPEALVTAVTIDVLMIYTAAAREKAGGRSDIVALAQSAINGENGNFSRSDIAHRMRLIQAREVGHTASGNLATELGWVAGNSTVASARTETGADLVALISDRDDAGVLGIAMQLTSTGGNSGQAFSANYYDTVAGVWPHEVGHNLGCAHNSAGVYSYSSGHYWKNANGNTYGSIMSYIGTRVPHFSNPDVDHWTGTTGTSTRDNARSIDTIGDNVAGYKTAKTLIEPSCAIASSIAKPREGLDFTLTVTTVNGGPSTATACKITVTLPSRLTLVSHNGGTAFSTSTKVWDVPDMADGAKKTLVLTMRANAGSSGVSLAPSAKLTSVGTGFVDFDLYNNEGSVTLVPAPAPTTDLVLHYALDETSGKTAHDSSAVEGGAQNATTTYATPQWQPGGGIIGGALRLTPTAQADVAQAFSYTSSSAILTGYPFTLALWVRATPGAWYQVCAMLGDQTLGSSYYEIDLNNQRAQLIARNTAQVWATSPAGLVVTDDAWHHLAAVFTSPTLRTLYVDGVPVATSTTSVGFVAATKRFSIGALMRDVPTQAFPGYLDDIGLWSSALAPERIALIHALGRYAGVDLDDAAVGTLLTVHAAQSGFAQAGDLVWMPASGLDGKPGASGTLDGRPYLVLDTAGDGFVAQRQPRLTLQSPGPDSILMTWHSGFASWILEESTDLAAWSSAPESVDDNGAWRTVERALPDAGKGYFRLKQPPVP